jgi:cardiolipin synthase
MILRLIPNALTLTRLVLIAPFLVSIYQANYVYAFYTFLLAGFTDALDGWLARSFHWQSAFGSFVDPIADKLLIVSSFIALACIGCIPWWLVTLVFLRDITISVGVLAWYKLMQGKPDFQPTFLSKINTVLQLSLVTLYLFDLAFATISSVMLNALMLCTTLTTLSSYIDYAWTWGKKAWNTLQVVK